MVMLVLSPLAESLTRIRGGPFGRRADRIRLIAALLGLALTAVIWLLVSVIQEEPLFGSPGPGTFTDSAVWLTMYGYALSALVYGARPWVIGRQTLAFGVAVLPFDALLQGEPGRASLDVS